MKICTKCKTDKLETEFYKIHSGKYLMSECKKCYCKRIHERRLNPEVRDKILERDRTYYKRNKVVVYSRMCEWRKNNLKYLSLSTRISLFKRKLKKLGYIFKRVSYGTYTIENMQETLIHLKALCKKHGI